MNWWDAVDVISSSGYYPADNWENQLDRIEAVVKKFDRPFFFAEAGCMSTEGSAAVPNDWTVRGGLALEEQADFTAPCSRHAKRETGYPGSGSGRGTGACRSAPGHSRKKDMNSMKTGRKSGTEFL